MKTNRNLMLIMLMIILSFSLTAQTQLPVSVDRPMAVAGKFYPADPEELRTTLKQLFSKAGKKSQSNIQAIICPHAGYPFSGVIAATSYNQIDPEAEYDNIFIIGSSHSQSFEGASVYSVGDYLTPLGKVPVNREIASKLIEGNKFFSFISSADETEHSIEVQVPFLQYHLKKAFRIVPIIIGTQSPETCKQIARALLPWFNEKNLFVISTDFSHYPSSDDAGKTDKTTADVIIKNSPAAFIERIRLPALKDVSNLVTPACGWTSVLTLLFMTSPGPLLKYNEIRYMNSGDVAGGDKSNTVGYWSIAVTRNTGAQGWLKIDDNEKKDMIILARNAIDDYLTKGRTTVPDPDTLPVIFKNEYGTFVTIREQGQLRGCIGQMEAQMPLYRLIPEMALAAATEDPRFTPLAPGEQKNVDIEISLLSPLKKVSSKDEVVAGKHGVLIRKGDRQGTLLPQVAREYNWNSEELLFHCAVEKAGLTPEELKTADIYVYEAVDFSEKDINANKN